MNKSEKEKRLRELFPDVVEADFEPTTSGADDLREFMDYYKITQIDMADHIGITQKHLSNILSKKDYMSIVVAAKIAKATGLSAKILLKKDNAYRLRNSMRKLSSIEQDIDKVDNSVKQFSFVKNV